jgi:aarF domain-containing kinase
LTLEAEPVGAGCIAQVYKGQLLNDDGSHQKVAVKLIHPHVRKVIDVDMYILRKMADFVEIFPSLEYLSLRDIVEEFAVNMDRQNDLRLEAKHLLKFAHNFKDSPSITFPRPIPNYVEANALVETFEEGESINLYMKDCVDTELKHKLVKLCSVSLLEMVFKHNFVHGDLHPGKTLYFVLFCVDVLTSGVVVALIKHMMYVYQAIFWFRHLQTMNPG